jgi:hypothetical protein
MTLLERLNIWSLDGRFSLFPFAPLVPLTDLAGNRGLVSADLRLWESRSDFQANCCWRRRLQISKFHRYMTQYVGVDNSGGRTARNVPD